MTEEEAKIIENFKKFIKFKEDENDYLYESEEFYKDDIEQNELLLKMLRAVLNIIQKLQEENKNYKRMLAEIHAQSLNNSISKKKKHEEQLEALNKGWEIELEKKDKIIDLMAFLIANKIGTRTVICENMNCDKADIEDCKMCAIQYFKNKAIQEEN